MPLRAVIAFALVAPWAIWAVVRLAGLESGYPGVAAMAFTPYAALGAAVATAIALLLRRWVAVVVAAVSAGLLLASLGPRISEDASAARTLDGPQPRLRVMTVNVRLGSASARRLVRLVRAERVDVLSLQEITSRGAAELAAAGMGELLAHQIVHHDGSAAGLGLYARFPLRFERAMREQALIATASMPGSTAGRRLELVAVHPKSPDSPADARRWRSGLRRLPPATPAGNLRILAGDFNATLDHGELRRLLDTGYADAAERAGAGLRPTWPSNRRFPPLVTIDHVLIEDRCAVGEVHVETIPGTDHRAVIAELGLGSCERAARRRGN